MYLNALNARFAVVAFDVDVNLSVANEAEGREAQSESRASTVSSFIWQLHNYKHTDTHTYFNPFFEFSASWFERLLTFDSFIIPAAFNLLSTFSW